MNGPFKWEPLSVGEVVRVPAWVGPVVAEVVPYSSRPSAYQPLWTAYHHGQILGYSWTAEDAKRMCEARLRSSLRTSP